MNDEQQLSGYVEVWRQAVDDFVALVRQLAPHDFARATDLAGWDVHAVVAHTAHLEAVLAGTAEETVDVGEPAHVVTPMGRYTEQGIVARRDRTPDELVEELVTATTRRLEQLRAHPPTDGAADPPYTPGGIDWDWATLLRNRPLDVWMHEQDIRRAVERPGGLGTPAAVHTLQVMSAGLPVVVGKRVAPPVGATVEFVLTDAGTTQTLTIDDARRAVPASADATADVRLSMDTESFVVLTGGRRPADRVPVRVEGDEALGRAVLAAMTLTP